MPELTVSMPAYNTGKFIKESIESVLNQRGIDLEIVVVDDGSKDNTVEVVRSIKDPRLKLIHNDRNMGIGFCHNLVIDSSSSPFIAHVDSDDIVMPGALRKMVDELKSSHKAGQAHCYFFYIDEKGTATRDSFYYIKDHLTKYRPPYIDYKWHLLVHGCVINHLRTYRTEIFEHVGRFNEEIKYGADYEMGVKIIDKYEIKLVPEFLYCLRTHPSSITGSLLLENITFWLERFSVCRELSKNKKISFTQNKEYNLNSLMLLGLYYILGLDKLKIYYKSVKYLPKNLSYYFSVKLKNKLYDKLYLITQKYLTWWPLDLFKNKAVASNSSKKIAYYTWQFPVLSETFIRRELKALIESGVCVEVIADEKGDCELDKNDAFLIKDVHYLYPIDDAKMREFRDYFYRKNPLVYLNLFIYVMCHQYGSYKAYDEDKALFHKAVYLAGILKERNISHIHTPWTDRMAFIAIISSRLLGIKYSTQARAHDLHRITHKFAQKEKFESADTVITNTKYNESHIKSILNNTNGSKIHTIYEGINLNQFRPGKRNEYLSNEVRILSVARLIEEKGLIYLLKACRILKDKGISFKCEIVGGSEEPFYRAYLIFIKKMRRQLELEDDVLFLGTQPFENVIKKYKESDIFVLPCVVAENGGRDISPNSLIEAMAMKLPVITTNISALPEIVDDGVNGLIVETKDEIMLAEAMIKLIKNYELRKTLGDNARKKIRERFNINKNIKQYSELFEN